MVVTLHPAVDRTVEVPSLPSGGAVRGRLIMVEAAGKGINVTHTLSNLGRRVVATGFVGRPEAEFFLSSLRPDRVDADFVIVKAATRHNVTVIEKDRRRDIHVIGGSMSITRAEVRGLIARIKRNVAGGDWVVFSGRPPSSVTLRDYRDMLRVPTRRGARLCVDTSGPMLRSALSLKPWVIKPNRKELEELAGRSLRSTKRVVEAALELLDKCESVLVSLGRDGAVLVSGDGTWRAWDSRPAKVVHTVGCGDALFAGFLSGPAAGRTAEEAVRFAVACGSACVRTPYACVRSPKEATRILSRIRVAQL